MSEPSPELIRSQLEQLLASDALSKSSTNRRLLGYVAQRSLEGAAGPKEVEIAMDVFGRDASFNCAEDSLVRVAMRSLRQKLVEHYAGGGKHDEVMFEIPKGAYRLTAAARPQAPPVEGDMDGSASALLPDARHMAGDSQAMPRARRWKWAAAITLSGLMLSVAANFHLWSTSTLHADPVLQQLRTSALWAPIVDSQRPVMFVLGDLFMYSQVDRITGRTQKVRDPLINSSDDLRAFLASNPELTADRGLRYSTMLQKSTAVSMAKILQIVARPDRQIEVRLRDELQADDMRKFDIVYVGPITRLGPLASDYHGQSRYHFDSVTAGVTDTNAGKEYLPEGDLSSHYTDYALVARYPGPSGNSIMIFTSGGRNAGLLQVVSTLTSPEGLQDFWQPAGSAATSLPASFEALLTVSGYKQTDLTASLIDMHPLTVATTNTETTSSKP